MSNNKESYNLSSEETESDSENNLIIDETPTSPLSLLISQPPSYNLQPVSAFYPPLSSTLQTQSTSHRPLFNVSLPSTTQDVSQHKQKRANNMKKTIKIQNRCKLENYQHEILHQKNSFYRPQQQYNRFEGQSTNLQFDRQLYSDNINNSRTEFRRKLIPASSSSAFKSNPSCSPFSSCTSSPLFIPSLHSPPFLHQPPLPSTSYPPSLPSTSYLSPSPSTSYLPPAPPLSSTSVLPSLPQLSILPTLSSHLPQPSQSFSSRQYWLSQIRTNLHKIEQKPINYSLKTKNESVSSDEEPLDLSQQSRHRFTSGQQSITNEPYGQWARGLYEMKPTSSTSQPKPETQQTCRLLQPWIQEQQHPNNFYPRDIQNMFQQPEVETNPYENMAHGTAIESLLLGDNNRTVNNPNVLEERRQCSHIDFPNVPAIRSQYQEITDFLRENNRGQRRSRGSSNYKAPKQRTRVKKTL